MELSFKHFEPIVDKYNNFVIPLYIELLEKHKYNIDKYYRFNEYTRINKELVNSKTTVSQLKHELKELEYLRKKINEPDDIKKFDERLKVTRQNAILSLASFEKFLQTISTASFNSENTSQTPDLPPQPDQTMLLITQPNDSSMSANTYSKILKENENQLASLQNDLKEMHDLFDQVASIVHSNNFTLDNIEGNLQQSQIHTSQGVKNLKEALKYKGTIYPIVGAAIGSCIGGPVGFLFGLKLGSLAAVSGAIIGLSGGSVIKRFKKKPSPIFTDINQVKKAEEEINRSKTDEKLHKE